LGVGEKSIDNIVVEKSCESKAFLLLSNSVKKDLDYLASNEQA
jgi:hypothetical protein